MHNHHYELHIKWTGNKGGGTTGYRSYERSHTISVEGKPAIHGSSDPSFLGDKTKYNPEDLLVASLSSCHMLWFLHLCSVERIVVLDYIDHATGTMVETTDGGGYFSEVVLNPEVTVAAKTMIEKTNELHDRAHKLCFIANSVNFPVRHRPSCRC